jgi:hypothetical protein
VVTNSGISSTSENLGNSDLTISSWFFILHASSSSLTGRNAVICLTDRSDHSYRVDLAEPMTEGVISESLRRKVAEASRISQLLSCEKPQS